MRPIATLSINKLLYVSTLHISDNFDGGSGSIVKMPAIINPEIAISNAKLQNFAILNFCFIYEFYDFLGTWSTF